MTPGAVPALADLALARRLERAEGLAGAAFVASRARLHPALGAAWRDVDGALALFDGVGSPLTQSFALGMRAPATDATLDALEAFFAAHGSDAFHEVSPMADPSHLALLAGRGYAPIEVTSVMHRPLADVGDVAAAHDAPGAPRVRRTGPDEADRWAETAARGWGETPELAAFMHDFGAVSARAEGMRCYVAELDGASIAAGGMAVHGGVALLAGASTDPAWRGRGAQGALLRARLADAAAIGCDLAMMCAAPGSASQRNAERQGFRIAYTRIKWHRALGAG